MFEYDDALPFIPNLVPPTHLDASEFHESHSSEEAEAVFDSSKEGNGTRE